MTRTAPTNFDDVIDSRDIIERLAELAGQWQDHANDPENGLELDDDERAELETLTAFAEEAADYCEDWQYGATLIRDSYFVEYAQELAEDIGAIPDQQSWPLYCIDWERAARELKHDYARVDFDGVDYWVR